MGSVGPVGAKGPQGNSPQGNKGPQGSSIKGLKGNIGNSPGGAKGPIGPTGPAADFGIPGPTGDTGAPGPKGLKGIKGIKGNSPGLKGPKGDVGPAACYSHGVQLGGDCGGACEAELSVIYSTCSTLGTGCLIYGDDSCTECVEDQYLSNSVSCWGIVTCEMQESESCGRSDSRLKDGIKTLENSLSNILSMNPVEYDWNELSPDYKTRLKQGKIHDIGFIAQEIQEMYPLVVFKDANGYLKMDYYKLNAVLVEGIKEQQYLIDQIAVDINYLSDNI